jgi:hypothetical protein
MGELNLANDPAVVELECATGVSTTGVSTRMAEGTMVPSNRPKPATVSFARYEVFDFGDETGDNSTVDCGQIQLQQHLSGACIQPRS